MGIFKLSRRDVGGGNLSEVSDNIIRIKVGRCSCHK